jgi:hypothetical protein
MENIKKDTPFLLINFFEQQATQKYNGIQREIDIKGYINLNTDTGSVKVFSRQLAEILISNSLPAQNLDTKTETTINGIEYQNSFVEGYKEGEQYFETEWKVSSNTLYGGAGAEQYVRDIHINFFHIQHSNNSINIQGWGGVKKGYPAILTHKVVKEFGYYSGIVNKVEEQVKKHPRQFATFDKCEHNLPTQQTETKAEQEKPIFTNNFDKIPPTQIFLHFKAGLVEKQYLTEQELNEYLKVAFELKTIPEIRFKIKDAPKKATIEAVFYNYYKNIAGKIHGKQYQYASLLGNYFEGYKTKTVSSNFSKSVY